MMSRLRHYSRVYSWVVKDMKVAVISCTIQAVIQVGSIAAENLAISIFRTLNANVNQLAFGQGLAFGIEQWHTS